jgi:prolyl-tRNA synthetase
MLQSRLFYKTLKEAPKTAEVVSHKLLLRGGFISQLSSGIYSFLPLGYRVQRNIENIIRQEMDSIGCQELLLPALQPKKLWVKSGRWNKMDPPLFRVKDRHKKEFALGSTHEEVITDLVKSCLKSYKDLPQALYQFQEKFRNEMRFTGGLLRTAEFIMKDLYSFHSDKKDFEKFFNKVLAAYDKIYKRCGLKAVKSEASGGVFTKEKTYEFQILSEVGEDKIVFCPKCDWAANLEVAGTERKQKCPKCGGKLVQKKSIEVGHTFRLGTRYSKALDLYFSDKKMIKKPVIMGCYGIGLGRLMATIVEVNSDEKGIVWPKETAPFQIHLLWIENDKKIINASEKLYKDLKMAGLETLYDDRSGKSAGEKFAEADLLGMPYRILISKKTLKTNSAEVKKRGGKKAELVKISRLLQFLKSNLR